MRGVRAPLHCHTCTGGAVACVCALCWRIMPTVAGIRKCRVQGCQRKPLFVDPSDDNIVGEATHCAAHREEGFPLQEGFSLKDGFLLQNGVVVHNTYRGSTAYRNRVSRNANTGGGGGAAATAASSESAPASSSRGGKQARGGKGREGGASRGRGGSVAQRASRVSTCQFPNCAKPATHGDGSMPTRCAGHKEKGQIDHKHRLCENVIPKPCLKQPSFGWPGESRKRFCGAHRRPGTVDLRNCEHEGCCTRASHGFGKGRARFCAAHSLPGTSVVANKPCEKEGCIVSPRFGYEGEKPRFCASHKEKQMVNLKDRRCENHPCTTQPTFAFPGEKPRFCSKHKSEGHVNVRHKLCRHPNCKLVPTYGTEGTRVPVACLEHSDGDMVDLKRARMRMSQARKASIPAAASSSSKVATREAGKVAPASQEVAPASPAVAGRVGAGAGAGTAPPPAALAAAAEAKAVTGKKRPRAKATQSLGGNAGIGRKIAEAIFASSQRVLGGEEARATEESEWEDEEDEAEASGEANDDDDDEDDEVEAEEGEGEKEAPGQSLNVPTVAGAELASEATASVSPLLPAATTFPSQPLPEGTSLSWSCAGCSKPVGPDDRHALVCCGYGVLHKACTTTFVHSQTPCPKCSRLVSSSLQLFV